MSANEAGHILVRACCGAFMLLEGAADAQWPEAHFVVCSKLAGRKLRQLA